MNTEAITEKIPQRPPFLFIDSIVDSSDNSITTTKKLTGKEDFFKGHFPSNPIMPGVLICESVFQTGALLMSNIGSRSLGVVTRIDKTKFKRIVRPGDTMIIQVELVDQLEEAYYFKGRVSVGDKTVMTTQFCCTTLGH